MRSFSRHDSSPNAPLVTIRPGRTTEVAFELELTRTSFDHHNKYGERYRDPIEYRHSK